MSLDASGRHVAGSQLTTSARGGELSAQQRQQQQQRLTADWQPAQNSDHMPCMAHWRTDVTCIY
jgi:hypothetical protein